MILDSPIITGSLSSGAGTSISGSFSGSFEGNGSGLTGITAEWDGTHTGTATFIGNITASGYTVSASTFIGDGSQLSGVTSIDTGSMNSTVITGSLTVSGSSFYGIGPMYQNGNVQITGSLDITSNISGSATSTGSFGYVKTNKIIALGSSGLSFGDDSGAVYMTLEDTGSVGIGITNPATKLHVVSTGNQLRLGYDGSNYTNFIHGASLPVWDIIGVAAATNKLLWQVDGVSVMYINQDSDFVAIGAVSASAVSSSTYYGDGSNLTGISAGGSGLWSGSAASMYTGDGALVYVSGSLIVSQSYAGGDSDSTALKLIGSGSVSGSGLFEVQGAAGTLFSVSDGLSGELFAVNDASGLSIISAHADRTVKLGKPGGFGIVISGSTPMPTNEAAKIFITGSIYHTGSAAQFSVLNVNGAYSLPQVVAGANDYVLTAQTDGTTAWSAAAGGGGAASIDQPMVAAWFF